MRIGITVCLSENWLWYLLTISSSNWFRSSKWWDALQYSHYIFSLPKINRNQPIAGQKSSKDLPVKDPGTHCCSSNIPGRRKGVCDDKPRSHDFMNEITSISKYKTRKWSMLLDIQNEWTSNMGCTSQKLMCVVCIGLAILLRKHLADTSVVTRLRVW